MPASSRLRIARGPASGPGSGPAGPSSLGPAGHATDIPAGEPNVGQQVARCREAAGLTQAELARRADMAQSTLSSVEADGNPRADTLALLARVLDVPVGVFFGDAADSPALTPEDRAFVLELSRQPAGVRAQVRAYLRFVLEHARHAAPDRADGRRKAS